MKIFFKGKQINLDDKQKEGKKFKLQGNTSYRGLSIAIENKKGSVRRGVNDDGSKWETKMFYPYGYIQGTLGVDGDKLDCYVNTKNKETDKVFIIHQKNPETGRYDEDKVMLGFDTKEEARNAYLAHYDTHKFLGEITTMNFEEFKKKALKVKKKPTMLRSLQTFLRKAFGDQMSMFGGGSDTDVMEGETRMKDGKQYVIKRSKKNPNVKRLFRTDQAQAAPKPKKEETQQPKMTLFDQPVKVGKKDDSVTDNDKKSDREMTLFGKPVGKKPVQKPEPEKSKSEVTPEGELDLFSQPKEEVRPKEPKKDNPIEEFGVTHLDSRIRQQRQEINKQVRKLLANKTDDEMTEEDIKLLATYSGRGGTDEVSLNEYYTPDWVAKFQWDMLEKLGYSGGPVLEPSCGTGVFLHTAPEKALVTGVEFDATSSRIANIFFGDEHEIFHKSFEEFNTGDFDKEFKAVIGNVPFGPRGKSAGGDPEKLKYSKHEMYFVDRAIDDLEENGVCSLIVPTGIMDNQIANFRLDVNKKAEFLGAIRMPTGVFKKANAQVTTDIVFFRKRPEEVIAALSGIDKTNMRDLMDEQILDDQFINGNFFEKNPEYVLGEEKTAKFGQKIWTGDITENDLRRVGELLKPDADDYSVLGDLNIKIPDEPELYVGMVITRNGRMYRLNENHRWERISEEDAAREQLSEELQEAFGVRTYSELNELDRMTMTREQLGLLSYDLQKELSKYESSNPQRSEMLKHGVLIGLEIKKFQKQVQEGVSETIFLESGTKTIYHEMSTSDAQREAQRLAMMLDDFKERYGHPIHDAKLMSQMGKSSENPFLYLLSSFDNEGNLTRLFTEPKSYFNVYHAKSVKADQVDRGNLQSITEYLVNNGFTSSAEAIKSEYTDADKYTLAEFKKKLFADENIFIDENGNFNIANEVCMGEVYNKLDYWTDRMKGNKDKLAAGNLTDEEKELLVAENKKLDSQKYELERRAEIKTLENLPVDMCDASKFFDVKYLNNYLDDKLGDRKKSNIIYDEKKGMFTFDNENHAKIYEQYMGKKYLSKDEKKDLEEGIKWTFAEDNEKNPLMLVVMNKINGVSLGNASEDFKRQTEEIADNFRTYLVEVADDVKGIENQYNRAYNNFIQKEYDGSVIEGLSKLDYEKIVAYDKDGNGIKVKDKIMPYNWSAVRRMFEQGKGMLAHGVGLGKTLESLLLGALAKESGRAKKPTYVVPKSVLQNWEDEINKWFKGDETKILVVGATKKLDKDGNVVKDKEGRIVWSDDTADQKKLKLSRLANEEFDYVLMTRDFYTDIKMSPQTTANMVDELVKKFYTPGGGSDKAEEKKMEKIALDLEREFLGSFKRDAEGNYTATDEMYFENLGIDFLVADEAHSYKNLIESVLHSDVKYLNVKHSHRANDFYFKSKVIRGNNNDQGIYTMTATPFSNSPMEAFNMLLPIAETQFEQMGIKTVDDFVQKFAETDYIPTMNAAAKITKKQVFTKFTNLNLLRKTFFKYADYKTADMVGAQVHFPKENPSFVYCDQSEEQKEVMKGLKLRLGLHEYRDIIGNIDAENKAIEEGITTRAEMDELREYLNVHRQKTATIQAMTGNDEAKDVYFQILDDMKKATADLEWYKDKKSIWADEVRPDLDISTSPKVKNLLDSVIPKYNDGGKQLIFASNKVLHGKLKKQLVEMGIPEKEILIVNGTTMKKSINRLRASKDYNSGKYKIVIGNYETMGEGLNFNNRTTDIHHLQPAWNALSIEQGNGRGIRQGNVLDKVNTHYYLTKGSIDAFFNQKILDKRGFVDEILNGKNDTMDYDEGDLSADEMQIALADNPEQARALLAKKNAAMERMMKEKKYRDNMGRLDQLFTLKSRLGRMEDKESKAYETLQSDIDNAKSFLNSSNYFDYKDVLDSDTRPIIVPGQNKVIAVGSIMEVYGTPKVVKSYSHSTGKVTFGEFDRYGEYKEDTMELKSLAFRMQTGHTEPAEETPEQYFKNLIVDKKLSRISMINNLPKEIAEKYSEEIEANVKENDSQYDYVIARKPDGSYVGASVRSANKNNYSLVFPHNLEDYFNAVDQAVKTADQDYDKYVGTYGYKSTDMAKAAAQAIYGKNWANRIAYMKKKAKGDATTESEDIEYEEAA